MTVWNLVDALSQLGQRRALFLPLASVPPGKNDVRTVDPTLYDITQQVTNSGNATTDIALNVTIHAPGAGFTDEDDLPDPTLRFHAVDRGSIHFKPATVQQKASLELKMDTFGTLFLSGLEARQILWWNRWLDANMIPLTFIYENVDVTTLQALLNALPLPPDNRYGVSFPGDVNAGNKAQFIQDFMNGVDGKNLPVEAGAFIGSADFSQPVSTDKFAAFHARYSVPATADPLPMNPRELFHLCFGNDSLEAIGQIGLALPHPLLARLQQLGEQATDFPDTLRMLLRPPLRTSKRIEWEAQLEIDHYVDQWKKAGNLTQDAANNASERLFNPFQRNGRTYNKGGTNGYKDNPKCNLFVWDIAIRSGFRASVQQVSTNKWHYISANQSTNATESAPHTNDLRIPMVGAKDTEKKNKNISVVWGYKIENMLRVQGVDAQQTLNDAIQKEGRAIILTGGRAGNNGHIVFIKEVLAQPTLAAKNEGFNKINIKTIQAGTTAGATIKDQEFKLGGTASAEDDPLAFVHLHLVELQPGGDPDTLQGLFDLNVLR
jgi:hypothetical protein